MDKITFGRALRYAALPGIIPQIKQLFGSGFSFIPYAIALVFSTIGLLPANHPYLRNQNMGRFGISHTIIEASRNLIFDRKHADQVLLFFTVILGLLLVVAQILVLCFAVFTQYANAGIAVDLAAFFVTPDPTNDVAHILLDRVFGLPDLFNSCVSQGIVCLNGTVPDGDFPAPYHVALHTMLQFYSLGVGVIGILIFMYYAVVVVVETSQTGIPFGRRFDKLWAPIRLVVAIGLLVPVSYGLNGAQLLTLHMAKWGSALATNGWVLFVDTLIGSTADMTITGQPVNQMVATPRGPDVQPMIAFFTLAGACHRLYRDVAGIEIDAWLVRSQGTAAAGGTAQRLVDTTWEGALNFYDNGDILVVFGHRDQARYAQNETGNVRPYCGSMILRTLDLVQAGARSIQESYYEQFLRRPWRNILYGTPAITPGVPNLPAPNNNPQDFFSSSSDRIVELREGYHAPNARLPDEAAKAAIRSQFQTDINEYVQMAMLAQIGDTAAWQAQLNELGWAGAGIWYNRIAELNGAMIEGVSNLPTTNKMPIVMEAISAAKAGENSDVPAALQYQPHLSNGESVQIPGGSEALLIAKNLWLAHTIWQGDSQTEVSTDGSPQRVSTKDGIKAFVNLAFGTEGLYSMRENTDVHPLAQLVTLGKHLLEASIRNIFMVGLGGSGIAAVLDKGGSIPKEFVTMISSAASTFGTMTLSIGFVLYYIIPFMPFMYFFFQVGNWVKELFEAMVGLPLWALAHIRIDEGGLPGPAGMNGYYLILEIFLRPILLIFGLIGAISIFGAQVQILHDVFDLVISNVGGFNRVDAEAGGDPDVFEVARQHIDTFFFTIMYAIIVYLLGTSSFKLIYLVPDKILRWMGSGVTAFNDSAADTPSSITGVATMAIGNISGSMSALSSQFLRQK